MGILKSLFTLGKSFISQAEESIEETQGVRMLEQHIRDAKAELDKAGKSRVDLLARVKLSHDKLKDLRERKASLEARALEALSKNVNPSLINEVAEEIARLENLITAEEQVLSNLEVSRDGVEKAVTATAQRIAQFEQQMEVVKATEAMQRAQQAVTTSTVGASSSVSTAAESLKRLQTRQAERQARLDDLRYDPTAHGFLLEHYIAADHTCSATCLSYPQPTVPWPVRPQDNILPQQSC